MRSFARVAENHVVAALVECPPQRAGTHLARIDIAVVDRVVAFAAADLVGIHHEIEAALRRELVAKSEHVAEFPGRIHMQQRQGRSRGKERLSRQMGEDGRVLAAREQQYRALRLGHAVAQDVNGLRLQRREVGRQHHAAARTGAPASCQCRSPA